MSCEAFGGYCDCDGGLNAREADTAACGYEADGTSPTVGTSSRLFARANGAVVNSGVYPFFEGRMRLHPMFMRVR